MSTGNWTWFNIATEKFSKGLYEWENDTFQLVLCGDSQSITDAFSGTSGNCEYGDLADELPTADGYTAGGVTITSAIITRTVASNVFSAANASWSLSANITFKYGLIFDSTLPDSDLLCYVDADTSGGQVTTVDNLLEFILSTGVLRARVP